MSPNFTTPEQVLDDCGCCRGISEATPVAIRNRAGLSAIAYRIGTHALFKQSMQAWLSSSKYPALAGLTTRDDDDFSIALLDAWATVSDVLTYYQERIANESYLRTATERFSIRQLARLIGYELSPGVAASAYLAFTVEEPVKLPEIAAANRQLSASPMQGYQPPDRVTVAVGTKVQSIPGQDELPQTFETIEEIEARAEWNAIRPRLTEPQTLSAGMDKVYLQGTAINLNAGDKILIVPGSGSSGPAYSTVKKVEPEFEMNRTRVDLTSKADESAAGEICVFREHLGFFGHNAPHYTSLLNSEGYLLFGDFENWGIWHNPPKASEQEAEATYYDANEDEADVYLERTVQGLAPGSWALFVTAAGGSETYRIAETHEKSVVGFGMTGKATGLVLEKNDGQELTNNDKPAGFKMRNTTAYVKSEQLKLSEMPFNAGKLDRGDNSIVLDGLVCGLSIGQAMVLTGDLKETPKIKSSEILFIADISLSQGFTKLRFSQGLSASYVYETVVLNANVALATHGETVMEVLGSGDGARANQQFKLRQPPLTHVSAAESGGSASTLQVRVNDLLWEEVPDFYGRGPDERIYVTRTNEDGTTTIQFGDGEAGARLPTGRENVRAQYRKGLGTGGNVKAGQLSQLMSRPLGLKQAFNPLAANGGDDPEILDNARMNAPINVLTLGRVVSLQDYEDFARTFAGVAKALATWTWNGTRRVVAVTVAGPKGADIKPDQATYTNLLRAMQGAGDPHVNLQVISYGRAFFRIAGTVWCAREYLPEKMQPTLQQALHAKFGFEARGFGQPVRLSEVMAVIQAVPGVEAVDIDRFYRGDQASGWNVRLPAAMPHLSVDGDLAPAELLLLDTDALSALVVTTVGKKRSVRHSFHRGTSSLKNNEKQAYTP